MRYSIVSTGMTTERLAAEAEKVGAKNIVKTKLLSGVFCDLDEAQSEKLARIPGLKIRPLKEYTGGDHL